MQKKFNNVQHFKINPSLSLSIFHYILSGVVFVLILFSSLDLYFKLLLVALLLLDLFRQQSSIDNKTANIEIRDNQLFYKLENDSEFYKITQFSLNQNRLFAELTLHLKDKVLSLFLYQDSFKSKSEFSTFLQNLRFMRL